MKRTIMLLVLAAVLLTALAPAASASVPGPGTGLLIGVVDTPATYAYLNNVPITLRGGWFAVHLPSGPQAVHLVIPGRGSRVLRVDVPGGSFVAVSFGQM